MRLVLCNCPTGQGRAIARTVIESRWAACVNVIPAVRSIYRWDGEVVEEEEETLLIKVAASQVLRLKEELLALHPYDTPEFVVLHTDAESTSEAYAKWVRASSSPDEG
jgi:periplasmic divalent cation tolerance protein